MKEIESEINEKEYRITISLDKSLCTRIQSLQKEFESKRGKKYSKSRIINAILVAGILGHRRLSFEEWKLVRSVIQKKEIHLNQPVDVEDFMVNIAGFPGLYTK